MGGASAWGIRSLADTFLRYWQPGLPCYLRRQNVLVADADYAKLGFMPSVTGGDSGINDTLIAPPPDVSEISLHNIGIMGGKLEFGANQFLISHSFVQDQMKAYKLQDPYKVWRDDSVMGLFYNHRLFSIESVTHEEVGSGTTLWRLLCNKHEPSSPGE